MQFVDIIKIQNKTKEKSGGFNMNKKMQTHKILSALLAVLFIFTALPFAAAADSTEFVSENAFRAMLSSATPIKFNIDSLTETADTRFNTRGAVAATTDGDTQTHVDAYAYTAESHNWIGVKYELKETVYAEKLTLYSGYTGLKDYYRVYASDTIESLYSSSNMVADAFECDGTAKEITLNKYVKYVSVIGDNITKGDTNFRVAEFQLWTGNDSNVFKSENVLQTKLSSATPIQFNIDSSTETADTRFDTRGAVAATTDGDTQTHVDAYAYTAESHKWIGVKYELKETVYAEKLTLYSGYASLKDYYRVYASDTLESLYSSSNMVADAFECDGTAKKIALNKYVKYVSVIGDNITKGDTNFRVAEFQLWTGDDTNVFKSENVLQTKLSEKTTVDIMKNTGNVVDGTRFNVKGALDISVDGDTTTTAEVYDCIDGWEYPRYPGARYTLTENTYIDRLTLYASGTFIVYASDALDTLYASYNCISGGTAAVLSGTELKISKAVKYLAVFCISSANVAEFQLWSGEKKEDTPDTNALKVLTIGNSYSENTSIYASEIAAANSKALTFGYLKFPSCTIEKHAQAAADDLAVYKFQIVSPDGTRTTLKTEAASFDSPNAESSATIKEALQYMDWDVVVLQQESFASRTASSFDKLGELIEYVKGYLPNARLAIHEVWRWGEWTADDFADIQANTRAAAAEYKLEYIPTGTAFENARKALGSDKAVNENDGHYQHANTYGQYIAGACYTASLFGITIDESTFASHIYVNDNGNVALLTKAVNDAVAARPIFGRAGDFTNDGFVGSDDLTVMRKWLLDGDDTNAAAADINGDDAFDVRDLVHLKKMIANI